MAVGSIVLCVLLAQAGAVTPGTPQQARDTSAPEAKKGTGGIKGKVVTAEGGRPIRRVQISLGGSAPGESKTVSTNSQGIFEFTELPEGRYTLSASRAGYLRLSYGQRRPGEGGRPIELADGQKLTDINFSLPRTSSIVGRITDEVGDPLPNASIFPMQWKYWRGQRRLVPVDGGGPFNRTDDTGGYRITGLQPGDYFVMATTRDAWTDEKNPKERIGFMPTFAPGTAIATDAVRVKVGLGQEVQVPDFAMVPGRQATISGTAYSSSGLPLAGESVEMSQEFTGPGTSSMFGMPGAKVAADGSFTIRNVSPGEYKLTLRLAGDKQRRPEGVGMTIAMYGDDLSGLSLVTLPGGVVTGRVVTDDGSPLPPEQKIRLTARPVDGSRTAARNDADSGIVRDDMTFELPGVFGVNRFNVTALPSGWVLKAIEFENKDLADTPIDASRGLSGLTVVLSKTLPKIRGTLLDDKGQPIEGAVIIFPEDQTKWLEESRLIRSARPDDRGAFQFGNVIPGDYLLVPVEYVRDGDWADPAFLDELKPRATSVRVTVGEPAPVSLVLKRQ